MQATTAVITVLVACVGPAVIMMALTGEWQGFVGRPNRFRSVALNDSLAGILPFLSEGSLRVTPCD